MSQETTGKLIITETAAYIKAVFVPEGSALTVYDDGIFFGSWYGHNGTRRGKQEARQNAKQWARVHEVRVR